MVFVTYYMVSSISFVSSSNLPDMREFPDRSVSFMRLNAISIATIVISFSLLSVANVSLYFSNFSFIKRAACQ
jgi:hypothetical protein